MTESSKWSGTDRRKQLLLWLKNESPLTGSELARRASVSRQVIVQDISLLKASQEPILATSQGYIYMEPAGQAASKASRIIVCNHRPEQTEEELKLIVDYGVSVHDVIVEHPVYGDLTAPIRVGNRKEVDDFIRKITFTQATYLSQLTGGIHLHTLHASDEAKINDACAALEQAGFLMTD